jgi:CubicO group peptidase (beta-lactamase class C family)
MKPRFHPGVSRVLPAVVAVLVAASAQAAPPPRPTLAESDVDAYVLRVLKEFDIPGASAAVVKDGRVALAKGWGVREQGGAPVDADTLFGIASNTKAFTAAALGILVQDGRLGWDDPVARHLPGFRMYDPYVSQEIRVRDLLSHRSGLGLGAGDLLYWPETDLTRADIVRRAAEIPPASSFRSRYAYSNLMYVAAGELVAAAAGRSWDDFVAERIFAPLGMKRSTPNLAGLKGRDNVALPHAPVDGTLRLVDRGYADNIAAAGGIQSSAAEMARWMGALIEWSREAEPRVARPRVLEAKTIRELWTPHVAVPIPSPAPELAAVQPRFLQYGLGFSLRDWDGRTLATHTGGLSGMVSRVLLLPEESIGVVVLTNQESGPGRDAIAYGLLERARGKASGVDWIVAGQASVMRTREREMQAETRARRSRDAASRPSRPLAAYAGSYSDRWRGEATIAEDGGHLVLHISHSPSLVADLSHWQQDTFVGKWRDRTVPDAYVTFVLSPEGAVDEIRMRPVSPNADFSYDFQDLLFRPAARPGAGQ